MSQTAMALVVKFIMTFLFAAAAFVLLDNNPWGWVLLVGVLATAINYLVGDLLVLPSYGNAVASIGDGAMGALTACIVDLLVPAFQTSMGALVLFGVLVAVGEYFFHQYLLSAEKVAP